MLQCSKLVLFVAVIGPIMTSIADTIRRFQAVRHSAISELPVVASTRLESLSSFGTNPGALDGWFYAPPGVKQMALVVVLHGCTQTAAAYDHGSGWSDLAERFGFAVLFPEQQRANNANLCFNWFRKEDINRGGGEALSIQQMIAAMAKRFPIDARRVFVTGLSAGGAMANVMLATYPELFAGGSIIAGLPYGSATSVPEAMERMRGSGQATPGAYAEKVRRASPHPGPWPRITVWHGDADHTVNVVNADAIVDQWRTLHGAGNAPDRANVVEGQRHHIWLAQDGEIAVEEYRIAELGHGTPLKTRGSESCGNPGTHMIEAGISSTWHQAQRWKLLDQQRTIPSPSPAVPELAARGAQPASALDAAVPNVTTVIERALRTAGLMW